MKPNSPLIKKLAKSKGLSLRALLREAGVSRTAYYHLEQAPTVVPLSIHKIAQRLEVPVSKILTSGSLEEERYRLRIDTVDKFMRKHPGVNRDNIWHTLILLEKAPIERLRGALRRAQR